MSGDRPQAYLEIAVGDALTVAEVDCDDELLEQVPGLRLGEGPVCTPRVRSLLCDLGSQLPLVCKVGHDAQVAGREEDLRRPPEM